MNIHIPSPEDGIVAVVEFDLERYVAGAVRRSTSPAVAAADLEASLDQLRERLGLLARARPDLLAELAARYGVDADPVSLDGATTRDGHRRLDERLTPDTPPPIERSPGRVHEDRRPPGEDGRGMTPPRW